MARFAGTIGSVPDERRVRELEQWGLKHQPALHRQGFGRVPVDDLLTHVKDRLPDLARAQGVDLIVWQCDFTGPGVEVVDLSREIAMLFDPSPKTLAWIDDIAKHPPVDLDEIEAMKEH